MDLVVIVIYINVIINRNKPIIYSMINVDLLVAQTLHYVSGWLLNADHKEYEIYKLAADVVNNEAFSAYRNTVNTISTSIIINVIIILIKFPLQFTPLNQLKHLLIM